MNSSTNRQPARLGTKLAKLVAAIAAALLLVPVLVELPASAQQNRGGDTDPFAEKGPRPPQRAPRDKAPSKDGKAEAAPPKPIPKSMRPPGGSSIPQGGAERAKLLDELYARLATAEDETVAGRVAKAIEHVWQTSGSDTLSLLIERARRAHAEKKPELALRLLDRAAELAPDHAEVFHRRAAVHFAQNNTQGSVGDLRRVLALDPNHFRALETLGQIFKEIGNKKAALEIYRRLYEVHPHMSGAKSTLDELEREVSGQAS